MPSSKKKAAAGAGSIRKKTVTCNGKQYTYWEARLTVGFDPGTGKQIQRSITGKTPKEVRQKLNQLATEVDEGTYTEPVKMTVGEWLDIWLDEYLGPVKPRTVQQYHMAVWVHLKPAFGAVKLNALKTADIQRLYTKLQRRERPLSAKSIKNLHGVLHKVLQQALELGYIRSNPSLPPVNCQRWRESLYSL